MNTYIICKFQIRILFSLRTTIFCQTDTYILTDIVSTLIGPQFNFEQNFKKNKKYLLFTRKKSNGLPHYRDQQTI